MSGGCVLDKVGYQRIQPGSHCKESYTNKLLESGARDEASNEASDPSKSATEDGHQLRTQLILMFSRPEPAIHCQSGLWTPWLNRHLARAFISNTTVLNHTTVFNHRHIH